MGPGEQLYSACGVRWIPGVLAEIIDKAFDEAHNKGTQLYRMKK